MIGKRCNIRAILLISTLQVFYKVSSIKNFTSLIQKFVEVNEKSFHPIANNDGHCNLQTLELSNRYHANQNVPENLFYVFKEEYSPKNKFGSNITSLSKRSQLNDCNSQFLSKNTILCAQWVCNNSFVRITERTKKIIKTETTFERPLKIATIVYAPFVNKTDYKNGTVVYIGMVFEFLNKIAKHLNFTYTVVEPADQNYGSPDNQGRFNGLIGMIQRNEVDIVAAALTITYPRSLAASFSSAFHFEYYGILIKPVADTDPYLRLFRIFSLNVWSSIVTSTLFVVLAVYAISKLSPAKGRKPKKDGIGDNMWTSFWLVFGVLINQITVIRDKTWSGRIHQLCWRICVLLLYTVYAGGLISYLSSTRYNVPFQNLDGLIDAVSRNKYKICIHKNTAFYTAVMSTDTPKYAPLRAFLNNYPDHATDKPGCQKIMQSPSSDVAYLSEVSYLKELQKQFCFSSSTPYILLNDLFFPGYFGLAFGKNFSYRREFSTDITGIVERGLSDVWKQKYSERLKCRLFTVDDDPTTASDQLHVPALMAAFVLVFTGLAISIVVFLVEKFNTCSHLQPIYERSKIAPLYY